METVDDLKMERALQVNFFPLCCKKTASCLWTSNQAAKL